MTEDELLIAHTMDLKNQCADYSMITSTHFLDMRQRSVLKCLEKEQSKYAETFIWGGFEEAERTIMIFVPKIFGFSDIRSAFENDSDSFPISVLRLDKDRFSSLTHRDYLGALMGLSIKRELLGDIIIDDKGAYLICLKSIEDFIINNLINAGRATITARKADFSEISNIQYNTKDIFMSVASTRLDCIVASAFSLSRTKSVSFIESGSVYVNGQQILKCDYKIDEGDKVVLRGKGKALLYEIKGESKKGRLHVVIRKYL